MSTLTETTLKHYISAARLTDLATDEGDSGATVSARITALIAAADGKIYDLLTHRFTTTQIDADANVQSIAATIVVYLLELRRSAVTEDLQRRYAEALTELEALRDGRMKLAAVTQELPPELDEDTNLLHDSAYFDGMPYTTSED